MYPIDCAFVQERFLKMKMLSAACVRKTSYIPSPGDVLRGLYRARTPESKVRVWSWSPDPIDPIGQLLSITVGRNTPAEGIIFSTVLLLSNSY